ncbi:sensor histidine kinase [Sphingomonas aurantiaca]|uniref:sensor histidine kinase n=1 Tax=Sphingomonas aurantiaca TaxID=185949 RepID=UPI00334E7302
MKAGSGAIMLAAAMGRLMIAISVRHLGRFILLVVCGGLSAAAIAQDASSLRQISWTAREGAPGAVQAIAQTPDGYLWIGSATGLYRFNGITFQRMPRSVGARRQSEAIGALAVTPSGAILVGHDWGGLSIMRSDRHTAVASDAMGSTVRRILQDRDGAIWTIAEGPNAPIISRFRAGRWRTFARNQVLSAERFSSAMLDGSGVLWITLGTRPFYLDERSDRLRSVQNPETAGGHLAHGPSGKIWLVSPKGINSILSPVAGADGRIGPVAMATAATPGERNVTWDGNGSLWGISRANGVGRYVVFAASGGDDPAMASSDGFLKERSGQLMPSTAMFDREGNLWVGSESGLEQFAPASFGTFGKGGLPATTRWAGTMVIQDGLQDVYLRMGSGLFRVHGRAGPVRMPHTVEADDVPCSSGGGGVWIRRADRELVRVGNPAVRHIPITGSRGRGLVGGCAEDASGRLWVLQAGRNDFGYLTERGQGAVRLGSEAGRIPNEIIAAGGGGILAYVGRGSLWRTEGTVVERLWERRDVAIEFVEFMYQGPRYLLMGGPAGLARYDGKGIRVLSSARFPFLSHLSGGVQTRRGETWLQNASGVLRMSTADLDRAFEDRTADLPVRKFDADDGLPGVGPYFSLSTLAEDLAGRVWVATNNGFAWADPARLPHNAVPPPVVITGVRVGSRRLAAFDGLVLPAGVSRIEIDYDGLSLTTPKRVRFRYMLVGVDSNWIDGGGQRQASYTNLSPGRYRFRVVAANNDGVWNRSGATLSFVIPPTFMQSNWFLALCCLGAACLLWALYSVRMRQVTARMRRRQSARLAERERIARDLHDTLLQGFQGLVLKFQSVANAIPQNEPAKKLIDQALDSADEVLSDGRESVLQLRSSGSDDLPAMLAETAARLKLAEPTEFEMVIEGSRRELDPVVREELRRIGDEALINAFRHSKASLIEVVVSYHRSALLMGIRDDGDGIDPEIIRDGGRQGHFGLVGMRERAAQIDGELTIASRIDIGTEVLVRIPGRVAYVVRGRGDWRLAVRRFLGMGRRSS